MTAAVPLRAVDDCRATPDGGVRAVKTVRAGDPYMIGHFPGLAVYPGVFTLESVQQAVARVVGPVRLTTLRSARFLAPLLAGDSITVEADITPAGPDAFEVRATCRAGGGVLAAKVTARYDRRPGHAA